MKNLYELASELFPINRSITGEGVRKTLKILQREIPEIKIHEVKTGSKVFDWTVPKEWNVYSAYIKNSKGEIIIDFQKNNLHLVGYSTPVNKIITLEELKSIVHIDEKDNDAIPYVTSYYKESYGFCMTKNQLDSLKEDFYHIYIDSELKDGFLTYGEILIQGKSNQEIFFSTYVCHPSMANNEISGPVVVAKIADYIKMMDRQYSYRFIFIPETIGSITYLSENLNFMKKNMIAGFNISCVGDNRTYSYVESRYANTLADKVMRNILLFSQKEYKVYSFLKRGSDERQYNSPGVDLPVCGFSRSKYGEYPEYHTSKDNMDLISNEGLNGSFETLKEVVISLENNKKFILKTLCEPQLGKRNLYPNTSKKGSALEVSTMMNILAYCDGNNDVIDISNIIKSPIKTILPIIGKLKEANLIQEVEYEF